MALYSDIIKTQLILNNEKIEVVFHPSDTLARVIREQAGLTGTKLSCENGDCGACTVQMDGIPVKSCLVLAIEVKGHAVTTIEGIQNKPLKNAFIKHNGFQCGYCTPGMIVNADGLFKTNPAPDHSTIRSHLQSNLCRCTGYEGIEAAVKDILKE